MPKKTDAQLNKDRARRAAALLKPERLYEVSSETRTGGLLCVRRVFITHRGSKTITWCRAEDRKNYMGWSGKTSRSYIDNPAGDLFSTPEKAEARILIDISERGPKLRKLREKLDQADQQLSLLYENPKRSAKALLRAAERKFAEAEKKL